MTKDKQKTETQESTEVLKKEEMTPGIKYRGYGMLTEWKEFTFIPEKTGSRKGREVLLYEKGPLQISRTKNLIRVKFNMPLMDKKDKLEYLRLFGEVFNDFTKFIKTHEL